MKCCRLDMMVIPFPLELLCGFEIHVLALPSYAICGRSFFRPTSRDWHSVRTEESKCRGT